MYLLGLDIGTTNWKGNLYDLQGRLIKSISVPSPERKNKKGHNYYDPAEFWNIFCRITKEIAKKIKDPGMIASVSFASMAEAGLIVDGSGRPLSHIIPWYDKRSIPEADILHKTETCVPNSPSSRRAFFSNHR